MAAPKAIKNLAGDTPSAARLSYDPPATPLDMYALAQAVVQLQNTVNALAFNFNLHQHSALNAAPATNAASATPQAAQNLFTAS